MKKNNNMRFYAVFITLLLGLFDASASNLTCDKRVVTAINKLEAIAGNDQAVKATCKNTYNVGNCSFNYSELRVESWYYQGEHKWILSQPTVDKVFKCLF